MSEVQDLIAEAKDLLATAEKEAVEHVDPTQLRVAVHRLELFVEHIGQVVADEPVRAEREAAESEEPDELKGLTRKQLDEKAAELGVEDPEKLTNKDAVVAAIREAAESEGDGETEE